MATLHLMVGLPCSGKSTEARRLTPLLGALLLSPDAWHLRLFGQDADDPDHDRRHSAVEGLQWEVATQALALGVNVILDFGFWSREERDDFRARARALGAGFALHNMNLPMETLLERLDARNAASPEGVFYISHEKMRVYAAVFQPVEPDEVDEEAPV